MNRHYIREGYFTKWRGCYVQVPGMPSKLFSYSLFSNEKECVRNAVEYRDWCVDQIGGWDAIPKRGGGRKGAHQRYTKPARNNKLGILGVHIDERIRYSKTQRPRWVRCAVAQLLIRGVVYMRAEFPYRRGEKQRAIYLASLARLRFERKRDRLLKGVIGDGQRGIQKNTTR